MKILPIALLGLILVAVALPTTASGARTKSCEGIGDTITKLRSKGQPCEEARTLAAMWAETAASGGGRVEPIHGFRCVRSNPPGPGGAVRCAQGQWGLRSHLPLPAALARATINGRGPTSDLRPLPLNTA